MFSRNSHQFCLWHVCALAFVTGQFLSRATMAKDYAILIGVGKYSSSEFADVPSATNETMEFSQILKEQRINGSPQFEAVVTVCDASNADHTPTKANILAQLRSIRERLREADPEREVHDSVIVFLNGHGVELADERKVFSYCPLNAKISNIESRLTIAEILDCLREQHESETRIVPEQLLLIVNACRNQPHSKALADEPARQWNLGFDSAKGLNEIRGVAVLFACGRNQRSYIDLKKKDDKDKRSYFFTALKHGWGGAADAIAGDRDGEVSLNELESFLKKMVKTQAAGEDGPQIPAVWTPEDVSLSSWVLNRSVTKAHDPERKVVVGKLPSGFGRSTSWAGYTFVGVDFSSRVITGYIFENCTFINCDFEGAVLDGRTSLVEARFVGCKMSDLDLRGATGTKGLAYEGKNEGEDQIRWGSGGKGRPTFFPSGKE